SSGSAQPPDVVNDNSAMRPSGTAGKIAQGSGATTKRVRAWKVAARPAGNGQPAEPQMIGLKKVTAASDAKVPAGIIAHQRRLSSCHTNANARPSAARKAAPPKLAEVMDAIARPASGTAAR